MATTLKIDNGLQARVKHLAEIRRRSPHWVMCEAIRQYVDHEEARESFKQEAQASWVAFRETGQHLTLTEVREWLGNWGTTAEAEVPECHE